MKWGNAKNSLVATRNHAAVEMRYQEVAAARHAYRAGATETVAQYLARGGEITRVNERGAIKTPPKTSTRPWPAMIATPLAPPVPIKRKAREAAALADDNHQLTTADIAAMIPDYAAPLPRRSWIAAFKAAVKGPERFADLA